MTEINGDKTQPTIHIVETAHFDVDLSGVIQAIALLDEKSGVLLTNQGNVFKFDIKSGKCELLFETNPKKGLQYSDGGFDSSSPATFYVLDDMVVLVNDFKTHGFVLNMREPYLLHIQREDNYAHISRYPIALFKDDKNTPHLIFSTAWNHLQIVNLITRQVLTADKSLIMEDEEKQHIAFYQKHQECNKLLWPSEYDYFFSKLLMSPDNKNFLSTGWVWGSFESHRLYNMANFLTNRRIQDTCIFQGEHLGRAACFVDNCTIAIPYNSSMDDMDDEEEKASEAAFWRIQLCNLKGEKTGLITPNKSWDLGASELFYCGKKQWFYAFSKETGLAVIWTDGSVLLHDSSITPQCYDDRYDCFLSCEGNTVRIFEVRQETGC